MSIPLASLKFTSSTIHIFALEHAILNTLQLMMMMNFHGAYELALEYSKERKAFGKEISKHQAIAFKLASTSFIQKIIKN